MRIELCEDNGFLNNGKPTLVVLVITNDEGKQIRMPYEANKTIQDLYQDVGKIDSDSVLGMRAVFGPLGEERLSLPPEFKPALADKLAENIENEDRIIIDHATRIEREDIVKCTNQKIDMDGNVNEEIEVGKEYRVIDIIKSRGIVAFYEVLDDALDNKIRIPILPSEVELVSKHKIKPPKAQMFETTEKCSACGEISALILKGNTYEGSCQGCGVEMKKERKEAANV